MIVDTTYDHLTDAEVEQINRQVQLEEESLAAGQERYWKRVERNREAEAEHRDKPAVALIRRLTASLAEAIQSKLDADQNREGRGRAKTAVPLIAPLEAEVLAHITLRGVMSSISAGKQFSKAAARVGSMVQEEIAFRRFREEDEKTYRITQQHIDTASTPSKRRSIMRRMYRNSLTLRSRGTGIAASGRQAPPDPRPVR